MQRQICNKIEENVYLGNKSAAQDFQLLQYFEITHIIVAGAELHPYFPDHFSYLKVDALDLEDQDLNEKFDEVNMYIKSVIENGGKVFVHW